MITTQQIGKCGELFVQFRLLMNGFESSPMTTDSGIDLVAYSPHKKAAITIQVKTNYGPKPSGRKGKAALAWWIEETNPAQLIALVDLSTSSVWLLSTREFHKLAQQHAVIAISSICMWAHPHAHKTQEVALAITKASCSSEGFT